MVCVCLCVCFHMLRHEYTDYLDIIVVSFNGL